MKNNSDDQILPAILMDTTPLTSAHSIRGIGTYTRLLSDELEKSKIIKFYKSSVYTSQKPKPKIDLIHYPYFDLFFPTMPLNFTKPTVVTIHDLIPLRFPDYYPTGIKGKINFERQKLALKQVAGVITDSHSSKKDIIDYLNVPEQKIHVVYLASNQSLQAQDENQVLKIKKKYQLPKKYILYVGDINYNKNIPQLIKSLKFLPPDVHLVCLGKNFIKHEIPEWNWIETQLALSDVGDRVKFLTEILTDSFDELSSIYSGALCYVQPSLWEGFGLPVLEAMQCRVPVVTSNQGSLPEVGGDHAIYSDPDAESLAKSIQVVLNWSKTKRMEITRSAYAWSQSFSWRKTAEQTIDVYKSIIKQ